MRATTGHAPSIPTFRVEAGESFTLAWTFSTKNAIRITASLIMADGQTISLNPGTPVAGNQGWTIYRNQRAVRINSSGLATLRVACLPGGTVAEKQIQFEMSSGSIETLMPQVDPNTRRVTFKVRNRGNAPLNGRFSVHYQIQGRNPQRVLAETNLDSAALSLSAGHSMDLGNITLPENAWESAHLWMRVRIGITSSAPVSEDSRDFTYTWPRNTLAITQTQISTVGTFLTGNILIHNYTNPSGDQVKNLPYQENASHIEILGTPYNFTFPYMSFGDTPFEYFFFINNFQASIGGEGALTIEDGKLCLSVQFDCHGSREAKGWYRQSVQKQYSDNLSPDVDIQRFNIKIKLQPTLRAGKISYTNPQIEIDSEMRFPGGWAWLNGFKRKMNDTVKSSASSGFISILNGDSVKQLLENRLTQIVMGLGATMGIHEIVSVQGSGSEIRVTYR
jgi:hypothetical protein